ncbi:MAG: hypothetical protein NT062_10095 [Proteobacteria bacterium]|nr:hypothetical protein [Pseudomonadota bacterium]
MITAGTCWNGKPVDYHALVRDLCTLEDANTPLLAGPVASYHGR